MDLMTQSQEKDIRAMCLRIGNRLAEMMAEKASRYTKHNATALLKGCAKFEAAILKAASDTAYELSDSRREVVPEYGYTRYQTPVSLASQIKVLKEFFPGIEDPNPELYSWVLQGLSKMPAGAEGWFAVPNWRKYPAIFGDRYDTAAEAAFAVLKRVRGGMFRESEYMSEEQSQQPPSRIAKFFSRMRQLGPGFQHLRESRLKEAAMLELIVKQKDAGILIFPAQFGKLHGGESIDRALRNQGKGEFGLGAFEIAVMLVMHQKRLESSDDLAIDCAGDEVYPWKHSSEHRWAYFSFQGDTILIDRKSIADDARSFSGSATFFFDNPQAVIERAFEKAGMKLPSQAL